MQWRVKGKLGKVSSSNQKMSGERDREQRGEYEAISKQEEGDLGEVMD